MEPPEPLLVSLGSLLAAAAGVVAAIGSAVGSIKRSRRSLLLESLGGLRRSALERLNERESRVVGRWVLLQALLLVAAAALSPTTDAGSTAILVATLFASYGVFALAGSALLRATAERSLPVLLVLLRPFDTLLAPFADPLVSLAERLSSPLEVDEPSAAATETEVEMLVNEGELSGALGHDQSEMIRNVLDFGDTEAGELMVPRPHVSAIDVASNTENVLEVIHENEHTRYPVYSESMDNTIGVLHVKDVFLFTSRNPGQPLPLREMLRPAFFIPETQLAESVLRQMRAKRHHMAIVIDEYGGMSGVLTLEDLLEEIVGEIRDEHDTDEPPIVELSNGHWVVDASVPIADINRQAGIDLPDSDDYHSLGGFIVEVMGRVPEPGAVLDSLGHRFLIRTADERHISKVEIVPSALMRAS